MVTSTISTTTTASNVQYKSTLYRHSASPIPAETLRGITQVINSSYKAREQGLFGESSRLQILDHEGVQTSVEDSFKADIGSGWTLCLTDATTGRVVGTASFKPYDDAAHSSSSAAPDMDGKESESEGDGDGGISREKASFYELCLVAADETLPKQGLGVRLLQEVEEALAGGRVGKAGGKEKEIVIVAFVIYEVGNVPYYLRRGYRIVGEGAAMPTGTWHSVHPFTLQRMEKVVAMTG